MQQKEDILISETVSYLSTLKSGALFKSNLDKNILNSLYESSEFWNHLLTNLHFTEVKTLEYLYCPDLTSMCFNDLVHKMATSCNIKRTAVRNIVYKLEKIGLIESVNSGLLFLYPTSNLKDYVQKFIALSKARFGIKNG